MIINSNVPRNELTNKLARVILRIVEVQDSMINQKCACGYAPDNLKDLKAHVKFWHSVPRDQWLDVYDNPTTHEIVQRIEHE